MDDKSIIFNELKTVLSNYTPPFVIRKDSHSDYHLYGTKTAKVGKGEYDGISFASLTIRAKQVTLGFFPIYTHPKKFENIDPDLKKCLKGKNCFHIKTNDATLYRNIKKILDTGMMIYKNEGWI